MASPDGNTFSYRTQYPPQGAQTSSEVWLAQRSRLGWALSPAVPQLGSGNFGNSTGGSGECEPGVAFSIDHSAELLWAGGEIRLEGYEGTGECKQLLQELVPGEPRGYSNLYLRQRGGPYTLINALPAGAAPGNATLQAATPDLSRIVFSENAQLTADSPAAGYNLYEWSEGTVRALGVLPTGATVTATLGTATESWLHPVGAKMGLAPMSHAVSDDGERVFFEADGNLYLRENAGQPAAADANCRTSGEPGLACTLQVDISFGPDASGGGRFEFASRDGGRVFFISDHRLTASATARSGRPDLYELDMATGELTDLTVASSLFANVQGISGGSDDGSRLYFVARGVLTGSQSNEHGEVAQAEQPNLYLTSHLSGERTLTYVATLSPWGSGDNGGLDFLDWWDPNPNRAEGLLHTAWSASGRYLVFSSYKPLTRFDNSPAEPGGCAGKACQELFVYDAERGTLNCVSCSSNGSKPLGPTQVTMQVQGARAAFRGPRYPTRVAFDSGQVFFQTPNPLSPADVNGAMDVYEYHDGGVRLISSGATVGGSSFLDASAAARDVFFATAQSLVGADTDGGVPSVYDARVDGGFAEPLRPREPCAGEGSCRSPAGSPRSVTPPGTDAVGGPGNIKAKPRRKACRRGKAHRGRHCIRRKRHRRHHHKRRPRERKDRGHKTPTHRHGGKD